MFICWLTLAFIAAGWRAVDGCSCMAKHPQTHFCNNDFAIIARVQKVLPKNNTYTDSYKVKVRRIFKSTIKGEYALKTGKIYTPSSESMCGIKLQPRETYVISGRIIHLQAHVDLCGFVSKLRDVTTQQKKGFRSLYKMGCDCKVHVRNGRTKSQNSCVTNFATCLEKHGVCLRNKQKTCRWARTPALKRCFQFNGPS